MVPSKQCLKLHHSGGNNGFVGTLEATLCRDLHGKQFVVMVCFAPLVITVVKPRKKQPAILGKGGRYNKPIVQYQTAASDSESLQLLL